MVSRFGSQGHRLDPGCGELNQDHLSDSRSGDAEGAGEDLDPLGLGQGIDGNDSQTSLGQSVLEAYHVGHVASAEGRQDIFVDAGQMKQMALRVHQLLAEASGPLTRHDIHAELMSDDIDTEE